MNRTIAIPRAVPIPSSVGANNYSPLHTRDPETTMFAVTDTKAHAIHPGLMPELLTGKIRLI